MRVLADHQAAMRRRAVALVAAGVVVLAALVVLRWRVRAPAENAAVAPDNAITAADTENGSASDDPPPGQVPVAAARPVPSLRGPAAKAPEGEGGVSTATGESVPAAPALPPGAPQEMVILHNAIVDAYERSDFEASFQGAQDFLRRHQPDNVYLKRVAAVSACAIGDPSSARAYYDQLDATEQRIVSARCGRYGVSF
jgi:hypothetical protein